MGQIRNDLALCFQFLLNFHFTCCSLILVAITIQKQGNALNAIQNLHTIDFLFSTVLLIVKIYPFGITTNKFTYLFISRQQLVWVRLCGDLVLMMAKCVVGSPVGRRRESFLEYRIMQQQRDLLAVWHFHIHQRAALFRPWCILNALPFSRFVLVLFHLCHAASFSLQLLQI